MNQEQEHVFQISVRRRGFIKSALAITAGIGLPEWFLGQDTYGASAEAPKSENDKPGIALIGCGGQGRNDCRWASYFGNVVAVCDVDENHLNAAAEQFEVKAKYKDFRKLLENKDVDVVINGTPDHWHTLVNIASFKAGKDVYGEKPLTLTIDEGRQLLKVYKETKRIFQTGSQQRSGSQFRLACELVRNGRIGKLQHIRVSLPAGRYGGPFQSRPVPSELDWDFWQGQTQVVDYVPERCHGSFRYWLTYSGGTMTDWGAHHLDIAQWGNGTERSGPVEVEGRSLVNMIPGGYNTPSQYHLEYTYGNGVRMTCKSMAPYGLPNGVRFEGSNGWIFVSRGGINASEQELLDEPLPAGAIRLYKSENHMGNFFDCIRTRKQPICEPEIGHRSVSVAHLGVLAMRLGRKLRWDPYKEEFVDDKIANEWVSREMRAPYDYSIV